MATEKLEGLSLSLCVSDILGGHVEEKDISRVLSSAAVPSKMDFDALMDIYGQSYWGTRSDRIGAKGREIAKRLLAEGKIEFTGVTQDCGDGHWRLVSIVSPLNIAARKLDSDVWTNGVSLAGAKMKTLRLKTTPQSA